MFAKPALVPREPKTVPFDRVFKQRKFHPSSVYLTMSLNGVYVTQNARLISRLLPGFPSHSFRPPNDGSALADLVIMTGRMPRCVP